MDLGPLPNPHGIAWHDGKFYFTAKGARLIARYDPAKDSVDWMVGIGAGLRNRGQVVIPVTQGPEGIDIAPDGTQVRVGCRGAISIIDVASNQVVGTIDTGGGGSSILITPDGSRAYIGMTGADKVAVLDLGKLEVVSEIKTGDGPDGMDRVGKP